MGFSLVGTVEDGGKPHLAVVAKEDGQLTLDAEAVRDGGIRNGIDGPHVVLGILVPSTVGVVFLHLHVAIAVEAFRLDAVPAVGDVGEGLIEVEVDVLHARSAIGGDGVGAVAATLQATCPAAVGVELRILNEGCAIDRIVGGGTGEVDVTDGQVILILVAGVVPGLQEGQFKVVPASPVGARMLGLAHSDSEAVVDYIDGETVVGIIAP